MPVADRASDLARLRERAVAALGGEHPQTGVSEMTPILRVGLGRIEKWSPAATTTVGRFLLDSPTGYSYGVDGKESWRARWRPVEGALADLTLHTDGVGAYLLEEADPQARGFLYHVTEQDRRQLAGMQDDVNQWFAGGKGSMGNLDILLAAYLDERDIWMRLSADRIKNAILKAFNAEIAETGNRPVRLLHAVVEYLTAAYTQLTSRQRETFHVLIDDGLPVLSAIDTALAL
jgi:hypothetical protein